MLHPPTGKRATYGELAADAAHMPVPQNVALKRPQDFKLIGTPAKRLDTPLKINGSAVYGIDVRLPGMKFATLAQSPVFGGRLKSVDDTAAKAVKGVRQIVRLDDAVAVVADHMGAAKKGLAALKIEWDEGPHAKLNTGDVAAELEKATLSPGAVAQNIGDVDKAIAGAATKVEASYQLPFLAHATMEPMNCTVHVRNDACEIWVGNQAIARAQAAAAKAAGVPVEKVVLHNHLLGGGFGRRLEPDGIVRAVEIGKHVDGPVKVVWTREEDIQHDMYRPYWFDRLSAGLDDKGRPVAWKNRYAGSSVMARFAPPVFVNGLDPDTTEGAIDLVYDLPNMHVEYVRVEPPGIPTAFWRSVGPSHNVFVTESFMDELAAAAKQDAVAYRRALLGKSPRAKAVLDLAAEKSGWGQPLPARVGRGVALQFVFASYMAHVAEVEVAKDGASEFAASSARSTAARRSIPTPSAPSSRARSFSASPRRFMARSRSRTDVSSSRTSIPTRCCGSTRRPPSKSTSSTTSSRRAASAKPGLRSSSRRSPTRSSRRRASACGKCRSTRRLLKQA